MCAPDISKPDCRPHVSRVGSNRRPDWIWKNEWLRSQRFEKKPDHKPHVPWNRRPDWIDSSDFGQPVTRLRASTKICITKPLPASAPDFHNKRFDPPKGVIHSTGSKTTAALTLWSVSKPQPPKTSLS